ncbi:MAG: DNA-directed RNA polymerase subunit alpha C-terminal domain-containing protein [Thermomicrobiales bacterium]
MTMTKTDLPPESASDLPAGLSAPARRALDSAGIVRLEQLTTRTEAEILKLHGMGPNAMEKIRHALAARGLSFG